MNSFSKYLFISILWVLLSVVVVFHVIEISSIRESIGLRYFIDQIHNEEISNKPKQSFYSELKVNYCGFQKDRENILFRFSMYEKLSDEMSEINNLLNSNYFLDVPPNIKSTFKCADEKN